MGRVWPLLINPSSIGPLRLPSISKSGIWMVCAKETVLRRVCELGIWPRASIRAWCREFFLQLYLFWWKGWRAVWFMSSRESTGPGIGACCFLRRLLAFRRQCFPGIGLVGSAAGRDMSSFSNSVRSLRSESSFSAQLRLRPCSSKGAVVSSKLSSSCRPSVPAFSRATAALKRGEVSMGRKSGCANAGVSFCNV